MNLDAVFRPHSIAVIGASSQPGSVGNDLVKNLVTQGYQGKIFPVNPKGGELFGRKVYPTVKPIPQHVDLAIIATPAPIVPKVLIEVGRKKIPAALVISSGFRESGNEAGEKELLAIAQKYHLTLIGPNCLGIISPFLHLNATFAPVMPGEGNVAFVSQSGALGAAVLDYARGSGLGMSNFISLGNKAQIGEQEILEYLRQDPKTQVIMLYVEQLTALPELLRTAKKLHRGPRPKPIIVLKSGRTESGAAAARSHTGALGGSDGAYQALFAQSGMIRAESLEEMFSLAECFANNRLPKGNRVAVVTNAGGPGVIAADQLAKDGLKLAQLSPATTQELQKFLPPSASIKNPVDILGDADAIRYGAALRAVLADPGVDAVLVILTPQTMTEVAKTARLITEQKRASRKPLVAAFLGDDLVETGRQILQTGDVATAEFPEPGAHSLSLLNRWKVWRKTDVTNPFRFHSINRRQAVKLLKRHNPEGWLSEPDVLELLRLYRLPTVRHQFIHSENQVATALKKVGSPAVLKIVSPDILHKSEVGGTLLNVTPTNAAASALNLLKTVARHKPKAKIEGFLVEQQVSDGLETIIGAKREPQTGAYLVFGLGGIYAEVFKNVRFGLVPLTRRDAERMVDEVEFSPIFQGIRGQPKLDRKAVVETIGRVAQLMADHPEITELDLNPVVVFPKGKGIQILDARLKVTV